MWFGCAGLLARLPCYRQPVNAISGVIQDRGCGGTGWGNVLNLASVVPGKTPKPMPVFMATVLNALTLPSVPEEGLG